MVIRVVVMMVIVMFADPDMKIHLAVGLRMEIMAAVMMPFGHHNDPDPIVVAAIVLVGHRDPDTSQEQNPQQNLEQAFHNSSFLNRFLLVRVVRIKVVRVSPIVEHVVGAIA